MKRVFSRVTRVLPADADGVVEAAVVIRAGGLVAFPTETVYGLGADAFDAAAVQGIFVAKGRPADDPLIVHLADRADLACVAHMLPMAELLAAHFWPGPLTMVLPRNEAVPPLVSAGRATVAVRVPAHPVAHALIVAAGTPVAAPSANRFGHTSPTSAAHVLADLEGRIDLLLDGGPATIGVESTVLDLTTPVPTILRPGGVSLEQLRGLLGVVELRVRVAQGEVPASPGLLERHYAPEHELRLCSGAVSAAREWLRAEAVTALKAGKRVGLLVPDEDAAHLDDLGADLELLGPAADPFEVARRLYAALRALDARNPDLILARTIGDEGLARAISDRLTRAASGKVVYV